MMPASQYHKQVGVIPKRRYCLVVDDDDELFKDYQTLCHNVSSFVSIEHKTQKEALDAAGMNYDCIIVDNDSFKIGEYRGLRTVEQLVKHAQPTNIIYTSALPDDKMRTRTNALGVHFVEKGHWRKLEDLMKEMLNKEQN